MSQPVAVLITCSIPFKKTFRSLHTYIQAQLSVWKFLFIAVFGQRLTHLLYTPFISPLLYVKIAVHCSENVMTVAKIVLDM